MQRVLRSLQRDLGSCSYRLRMTSHRLPVTGDPQSVTRKASAFRLLSKARTFDASRGRAAAPSCDTGPGVKPRIRESIDGSKFTLLSRNHGVGSELKPTSAGRDQRRRGIRPMCGIAAGSFIRGMTLLILAKFLRQSNERNTKSARQSSRLSQPSAYELKS